jgi:hypothetical protein
MTISFWLKKVVSIPLPSVMHGKSPQMDKVELSPSPLLKHYQHNYLATSAIESDLN